MSFIIENTLYLHPTLSTDHPIGSKIIAIGLWSTSSPNEHAHYSNLARRTALKMKPSLLISLILCWIVHGVSGIISNELETIDTVNVAEEMVIGTGDTGLPESLQGLFWMEGNPAPEVVTSLGGSVWDADSRTIVLNPSVDEGVWAYNDSLLGNLLYGFTTPASSVMKFNEDITYADISVNLRVLGITIPLPQWLASSTMFLVEDGLWERGSAIAFFVPTPGGYNFRRIVTADGEPTDSFADFVASNPETLLVYRRPS